MLQTISKKITDVATLARINRNNYSLDQVMVPAKNNRTHRPTAVYGHRLRYQIERATAEQIIAHARENGYLDGNPGRKKLGDEWVHVYRFVMVNDCGQLLPDAQRDDLYASRYRDEWL